MTNQLTTSNLSRTPEEQFEAPWYRHPMVWMIIMLPAIVVIASIYTIVIAHKHAPTIVPKAMMTESDYVQRTG